MKSQLKSFDTLLQLCDGCVYAVIGDKGFLHYTACRFSSRTRVRLWRENDARDFDNVRCDVVNTSCLQIYPLRRQIHEKSIKIGE